MSTFVPRTSQVEALEGLQIFSALGYSLGLPDMAGEMEELCFRALFPESMGETNAWLRADRASLESALAWAKSRISEICTADDGLQDLCAGFEIKSRTKSLISIMKVRSEARGPSCQPRAPPPPRIGPPIPSAGPQKLLALHESGSRKSRSDLHDLLGVRVIVHPRTDMPADDAELLAEEACHRICSLVHAEWEPVEGRQKDYIRRPKDNGYQSLHTTVALPTQVVDLEVLSHQSPADDAAAAGAASQPPRVALEVQIRTAGMDARAEGGDAAHGAYKSGLSADAGRAVRELAQRRSAGEGVGAEGDDEALEEASAEGLFRSMDLDGNGVVSKDEVEALLSDVLGGSDRDRLREATLEVGGVPIGAGRGRRPDPPQGSRGQRGWL